ncbi:hypothetical protein [Hyphomicrobium sp. CS1GBMeth3]|uniref:hypothetical protein n=1 Tax=Hyphomicrobium sp. CS1GBMeth3 TaxID=1892845 RepID=UPI0009314BE6|nr:hypothetical protein [Hyphomicrobium sp. CS1GBMeth3]
MSLFRIAVILSLGIAVMPSDEEQQEALYTRAATAAHWTVTYCDRNGQQCELAGDLWHAFLRKAQFAGKLAYDVAIRTSADTAETVAPTGPVLATDRGTLKAEDLRPDWRAEPVQQGDI